MPKTATPNANLDRKVEPEPLKAVNIGHQDVPRILKRLEAEDKVLKKLETEGKVLKRIDDSRPPMTYKHEERTYRPIGVGGSKYPGPAVTDASHG